MENTLIKQNILSKVKKGERRFKRFNRLKPKQQKVSIGNLLNRNQKRAEIKNQLIEILKTKKNLAIKDIQEILGLNRNSFNYWIDKFEKEGYIKKIPLEHKGISKQGQPKTLILNPKFVEWVEENERKFWASEEEKMFNNLLVERMLSEIDQQQSPNKKYKKLIELFKKFKKDSFGAKWIFLTIGDYVKIDYKFSLTERGKKLLGKIEKNKPKRKT